MSSSSSAPGILHKEIFYIIPFIGGFLINKKQLIAFCHARHVPREDWKESALDCANEWFHQQRLDVCVIPLVGKEDSRWVSRYFIALTVSVQFPGTSREAAVAAATPTPETLTRARDSWFHPELRNNNPRIFDKDIPWRVYDWTKSNSSILPEEIARSVNEQCKLHKESSKPTGENHPIKGWFRHRAFWLEDPPGTAEQADLLRDKSAERHASGSPEVSGGEADSGSEGTSGTDFGSVE